MKIKLTAKFVKIFIAIIALVITSVIVFVRLSFRAEDTQNPTSAIYVRAINNNHLVSGLATLVSDRPCQEERLAFSSGYAKCTTAMGAKVSQIIFNDIEKSVSYYVPLSKLEYHSKPVTLTSPEYFLQIEIGADDVVTIKQLFSGNYIDITNTGIIP